MRMLSPGCNRMKVFSHELGQCIFISIARAAKSTVSLSSRKRGALPMLQRPLSSGDSSLFPLGSSEDSDQIVRYDQYLSSSSPLS